MNPFARNYYIMRTLTREASLVANEILKLYTVYQIPFTELWMKGPEDER